MDQVVAFDARDAFSGQLRGWGRYARSLLDALRAGGLGDGLALEVLSDGGAGPEVVFEQVRLPLLLRARRAAVVHAPNCFLPLVRPCAGVVTVHDLAFEAWPEDFAGRTRWKYRRLARAAARSAERVICPSRFTAEDVTRRWGIDPARIRVVPEAPALPAGRLPEPPGPYVLAVGDLRRKKNLEALVRAFVAVRTRAGVEHRLLLAGLDAGSGQQLRAVAAGAPVALLGYVGDEQLDALIRGADLLVHPSLYEGFGLVVLEAMARGTPVLAARATALPETGGDAAAYFEPAEPAALADALERLLTDRSLRDALAQRGLARAASFSWREAARATAEVYREVL